MSESTWKCIICGTTIYSKCPSQRHEHYGMEVSILKSVFTIDRVHDHKGSLSEFFLSYTCGADRSTPQVIKDIAKSLTKKGITEAMTCDHHWVLNSKTETQCTLGCTHSNLNDVRKLRAAMKKRTATRTVQNEVSDFAYVVSNTLDLARRALNISKPKFDRFVEQEFDYLKSDTRKAMNLLAEGKPCRPLFRALMHYASYEDNSYAYFDREEDAIALARGLRRKLDIEKLNLDDDSGYKSIEYTLVTDCPLCGKPNLHDNDIIADTVDGPAHLKCIMQLKRDNKIKTRYARFSTKRKLIDMRYEEVENVRRGLSADALNVYACTERNCTYVYLKSETDKATMEKWLKHLKTVVFI